MSPTFSSTASGSKLKRSAMGRILSGRKVPSVSMYATCNEGTHEDIQLGSWDKRRTA
jgi:hypothetical protein